MDGRPTSLPRCSVDAKVADERLELVPIQSYNTLQFQTRLMRRTRRPTMRTGRQLGSLIRVVQRLGNERSDIGAMPERRRFHLNPWKRPESA